MADTSIDLMSRLDDDHRGVLELLPPGLLDLTDIAATRANLEGLMSAMPAEPLPDNVAVEDHHVAGLDGDPDVLVRTYRPADAGTSAPGLYWIHGGGMVLGSVDMDDAKAAGMAAELGCVVASVEYRLAPEHPFPAPLHDCVAGLAWFAGAATDLGVDPSKIAIGGASAGGGLAAGTALHARDNGGPALCFQLLVYPMIDDTTSSPSSRTITDDRVWNTAANEAAWKAYLGDAFGNSDVSPYAAPTRATDLSGLPPAYLNVGDLDLFMDEDLAYASRLRAAGVSVEMHVYPGAFHGSNGFVAHSPLSIRWQAEELLALRNAWS